MIRRSYPYHFRGRRLSERPTDPVESPPQPIQTSPNPNPTAGNIEANAEGRAEFRLEDKHVRLMGAHSVIGRAVVVKAQEDDLGRVCLGRFGRWCFFSFCLVCVCVYVCTYMCVCKRR